MNKEYIDTLEKFHKHPEPGQYLMFQEYREGHGGSTLSVVDIVSFTDEDINADDEDPLCVLSDRIRRGYKNVRGWCDSTAYDGLVDLELWDNGEVYLSGDGINHPRYRVVGMQLADLRCELDDSCELTTMHGCPVYWGHSLVWIQDSWDDRPGTKVEYYLRVYQNEDWSWESRKAFGKSQEEVDELVNFARAELKKPKYGGLETKILVAGEMVESTPAIFQPTSETINQ